MGASASSLLLRNINFEDIQISITNNNNNNNNNNNIIINTLESTNQNCLIKGTIPIDKEETYLNSQLPKNKQIRIIIYGMNSIDYTIGKKYEQLIALGFTNVYIYAGGLFEWLLLQDIYGKEAFPTTSIEVDLLKYKGRQQLNIKMLCL
jgi:hypothetical protein